jgi:UDPglucose--hexose-1-phosphate uridylyltransferase
MAEQGYCPLCLEPSDPLIIIEEDSFRAFSPLAPRFQRETWIAPVHHEPAFTNLKDREIDDLAALFKKVLSAIAKLHTGGENPKPFEYNLVLHTEPLDDESGTFHTHIEILPRPEALAGFEIGSGMLVNPIPPEQTVSQLREILFT